MRQLPIEPLSRQAFAPFGDVLETRGREALSINAGTTERYDRLAEVELSGPDDRAIINIFRARALSMPMVIRMLERHPRGSQAFMPLLGRPFLIVVAPAAERPDARAIRAFLSDGTQGVNYHRGVWHHPVLALHTYDDFLVIDRAGPGANCDEHALAPSEQCLLAPGALQGLCEKS